jgi:hypothetical protein
MVFKALIESDDAGELILVDGGLCRWHLRNDGVVVIYEIISQRPGAGQEMVRRLCQVPGATHIEAKCPAEFDANDWYRKKLRDGRATFPGRHNELSER